MSVQQLGSCCTMNKAAAFMSPQRLASVRRRAPGGNRAARRSAGVLWRPLLPYWTRCWGSRQDAHWNTPQCGERCWSQEEWGSNPSSTPDARDPSDPQSLRPDSAVSNWRHQMAREHWHPNIQSESRRRKWRLCR